MKINPISGAELFKAYKKVQPVAADKKVEPQGMDKVTFSDEALSFAKTMDKVREALNDAPAAKRQDRLDAIADKIRTGQYKVDSKDVASKMVSDILERYKD